MAWSPKSTVVVPVDFSPESMAAVDVALELVAERSGLHVVHVLPLLAANDPAVMWHVTTEETARENIESLLREKLSGPRYEGVRRVVMFGSAPHEIAEYAGKVDAQLIVLPSHGRTGIRRLMIGSVAERVVRHAHCPVLVLRD